jgi:hypothetical protein
LVGQPMAIPFTGWNGCHIESSFIWE